MKHPLLAGYVFAPTYSMRSKYKNVNGHFTNSKKIRILDMRWQLLPATLSVIAVKTYVVPQESQGISLPNFIKINAAVWP